LRSLPNFTLQALNLFPTDDQNHGGGLKEFKKQKAIPQADPGGSFRLNPHSFRKTLALLDLKSAAKAARKSADKTGMFLVTSVGKSARRGQKNVTSYSTAAFQAIFRRGMRQTSCFAAR
jgi:hypothetical protein